MTPFSTLSAAIQAQLAAQAAFAGVALIQEDAGDVPARIEKEIGRIGMGVVLGVPDFSNQDPLANLVNARVRVPLTFMEAPPIWRSAPGKIHCADAAQAAAQALQGLVISGFQPLRVLRGRPVADKEAGPLQRYRLDLETMQIFGA
ncbi:MAG: hypothetical protein KGJ88_04030 [Verrucomicrobiota bacterium]|nr:hypothetical protein [Verrucomicrobiota bacterium]